MDVVSETVGIEPADTPALWVVAWALALALASMPMTPVQAQESPAQVEFLKYGSMATHVDQSSDGEYVAVGLRKESGAGSEVILWSTAEQKEVWSRSYEVRSAPRVAFDSTGSRLAVGTSDGRITVWDLVDGSPTRPQKRKAPVTELEFGPKGTLGAGVRVSDASGSGERGEVRVWSAGMGHSSTTLGTDASIRTMAFRPGTSEVVFASDESKLTLWNYRFNTTKTINTADYCSGKVVDVILPPESPDIYFITQSYATCDPEYFCMVNGESKSLVNRYRRKNIRNIEPVSSGTIAYSRGRYVYTLDVRSGTEKIVYESRNTVNDLSYANGTLAVANSDVVLVGI